MLCCDVRGGVRRWLTLVSGMVECLCFSGAVFGWASLVVVLKSGGYFSSLCVNGTGLNGTAANGTQELDCSGQDQQLSLVFTIAAFVNNFLTLSNGFLFDHFGTTVSRLFGISLYTTGALFVAFSSPALSVLLYPALSCIAMGGIMLLITNMQVGNLFGSQRSTIITLYNGAFDSSSALFLVIKLMYESGVSLMVSFGSLAACSVIHLVRTFLLLPGGHIPYPLPPSYTYGVTCRKSEVFSPVTVDEAPPVQAKSFWKCVFSRLFMFQLLWLSVMQLRHYLFIGTLNPTLQRLAKEDPSLVSQYTNAFAITQLCGVLFAPWNGLIMDRQKSRPRAAGETESESDLRAAVLSLALTALLSVLFSVSASVPLLPLQYLTFILQVLSRSFLYGGNAAFISIAFPSVHFGKLYGLIMALSAVISLLQYPCTILIKVWLGGDPFWVNVALIVLCLTAFIHPVSVRLHCRKLASQRC
ncbi:equilibrative nucleobase transporter 1-like [Gadus chalcogrammus]|uniref:equilibrative nucleobase transporter 1-like n=1 Tax=Gadus chalcogrammus TaxID=1042646 RepID=UPI0024C49C21|nr:equilibrative nucleobase transporter 1-like [Gadus chalcogrammus]XP_056456895.1 equilibrative nucleobase transporter 1-like [Gadus chalcogrammus]XP_056456896.1 equilibrative nucleobase transporter 1-like [Gadus chalcogrammus]XP_056456897.1 equilibrative nucleobase transporter 1-like [Gadus chalcogrammus]XP_056456898.1 equilibrative nucleobase transporter 1-like [Gadus chalcogrammus]